MTATKIAFCGLGLMGNPMVERLLAAGHEVSVWNRSPERLANVVAMGARAAATPADAAAQSEFVFLCLFDAAAVESVVFGPSGIAHIRGPRCLVDHSSIAPAATREFATRLAKMNGAEWVDAPMSGGVAAARAGALTMMAGGSHDALAAITKPIGAYAARLVRVGPVGAGQMAKLCNQTIVTATLLAIGEAVILARRTGIDPALLPVALEGGWAELVLLRTFVPRMVYPPAQATGTIATLSKDADAIADAARDSGTAMPVSAAARELLLAAVRSGLSQADLSRVVETIEANGAVDTTT